MSQSYAIFGLGRYGRAVALELLENGAEVLAVDIDEARVNAYASVIPLCKCADITDADTLQKLGIANMDAVVIAMAGNLESAVMATMLCKEMNVKTVIVKCASRMHCRILRRVGADRVVLPEEESGVRLAKTLLSASAVDIIDLSRDVSVLELAVREEWIGKSLLELNLRRDYSINVVAIRQGQDKEVNINVDPAMPFTADMKLIAVADRRKLAKLD